MNRRYGDEDFQSDPVLMTGVLGSSLPKFTSVCVGFSPCGDAMLACRDGRTCYRWGCWENCLSPKREGALADSTCDCITFPQRVDLGVSANATLCDIRRSLRVFRSLRSSLNRQHAVVVFESGAFLPILIFPQQKKRNTNTLGEGKEQSRLSIGPKNVQF